MHAMEFTTELSDLRILIIPKWLAEQLPKTGNARVIVLTDEMPDPIGYQLGNRQDILQEVVPEDVIHNLNPEVSSKKRLKAAVGSKAKNTKIKVMLPNGIIIQERVASDTFAKTIEFFGVDKVEKMGIIVNNVPLITSERHPSYQVRQINDRFVSTHSATAVKKSTLESIAKDLNIEIVVETIKS